MRPNLDALHLATHRPTYTPPVAAKTTTSVATPTGTFQQVMQQQSVAPEPIRPSLQAIAALPNGGLMLNPTGNNALTGGTIPYNPNYYATLDAAARIAQQTGGTLVDLRGHISNNQAEYFVNLPNGTTINAGNLVAILNNPVYQENSRVMDGKIAELLNNNAVGSTNVGAGKYTVTNGQVSYVPAST